MAGKSKAKESVVDEEIIAEEVVEQLFIEKPVVEAPVKKAPKKFAPDERIECRSVTVGKLDMIGPKTKLLYSILSHFILQNFACCIHREGIHEIDVARNLMSCHAGGDSVSP